MEWGRATPERREMLCPILWTAPFGLINVTRRAIPLTSAARASHTACLWRGNFWKTRFLASTGWIIKYRMRRAFTQPPVSDVMAVAKGNEISEIIAKAIQRSTSFELVAKAFRENLVQQNLDDFVRDHPFLPRLFP
jgi:hypothetical protein